ncbi:hypothetical protein IMSAG049_01556 [Clostridiales bacterium]|nr:hypothetical protein IMSAG049_01556 [Clostridiales bacterium]
MKSIKPDKLREFEKIYKELDYLYHEVALKAGISDSVHLVLYTICENNGSCMQKDICEAYSISKQTINSAVRKLEKEGYIVLKSTGGRDKFISLTELGEKLAEKVVVPVMEMEVNAIKELSADEMEQLLKLSRKFVDSFRKHLK